MSPQLSIIIVSYNTRDITLACLESVYAQTRETSFEVIVLDNASSDGSADAIAGRFPQVRLIRHPINLGFAGGNNLAAKDAAGEFLLLLNPDTVVLNGAIDTLMAFARANPGAGIWGGRTVFADGTLNPTYCWKRQTAWSAFCCGTGLSSLFRGSRVLDPEAMGAWNRDQAPEVDIVSGCFLLITRALWDTLGGFDPAFFMYGEEADMCLRAREHEQRPGLIRAEPAQVDAATSGESPTTTAALLGVDRHPRHRQGVEVAAGGAFRDLELFGHLCGGHLLAPLQHQQDRHESVGAHVASFSDKPVRR